MINAWSDNAKKLLESVDEWDIFDVDLGGYGEASICFDGDGVVVVHDNSKTELEYGEIDEIIQYALGNLNESECFWYEPEEPSADELEEEREYQKFWHCQPRYSF